MKKISMLSLVMLSFVSVLFSQSPSDSVTLTFRAHQANGTPIHVPGQFNNWTEETGTSLMVYSDAIKAWLRTYTFKIHDSSRTPLGDSVFQYKFNKGGNSTGWYSDPLNPEQNASDHGNSVLRMSKLFYFEFFTEESSSQVIRIAAGIFHANSDSISSVTFSTGTSPTDIHSTTVVTSSYDKSIRILNYILPVAIPKTNYIRLVAVNNHGDSIVYMSSTRKCNALKELVKLEYGTTQMLQPDNTRRTGYNSRSLYTTGLS